MKKKNIPKYFLIIIIIIFYFVCGLNFSLINPPILNLFYFLFLHIPRETEIEQ